MQDVSTLLLGWIIAFGAPMVGGLLFLGQGGVPLPGTLIVIATGAFVQQGYLDAATVLTLAFAGAVLGDLVLFGIGRVFRAGFGRRAQHMRSWKSASTFIEQRGGMAVFLTRWLVTPLATATTLVAGAGGFRFRTFVSLSLIGEALWILLYGSVGYALSGAWETVSEFASMVLGLLVGLLLLGVGVVVLVRMARPA